tara:strand:- start:1001 stop:2086 length:1086 start_codon:yes stop_codon:yes gene_type:complete
MTEKKIKFLLLFSSLALAIFIAEIFCSIIFASKFDKNNFTQEPGYMLYEQGDVFINADKVVKYHPNKKILTKAFVYVDNNFKEAYSYEIETNNFGLVQKNDLQKDVPSILILGDSFTEGQGEAAWVNKFGGIFKEYQIIGGGILATGPQQFAFMEEHVSTKYDIDKILFLYIGHDIRRSPFMISKQQFSCLKNYKDCEGNEIFFGFPLKSKKPDNFLNNLRDNRIENFENLSFKKRTKIKIKNFFSQSYVLNFTISFLKEKFYKSKNIKIKKNLAAMKKLNDKYGDNIYFVNLKTFHEVLYQNEYETNFAEKYIKNITNNYYTCDFENNLDFFDPLHGHPNKEGYDYLFNCIFKIMNSEIN